MKLRYIPICLLYSFILHGLDQEQVNKWALKVESKMAVSGPIGEMNARNFLKEQGVTNFSDVNSIINLALELKKDSKLKLKLSEELPVVRKEDTSSSLSLEDVNNWALQAESKMKGAGGEILVRAYLKDKGITNKKDQTAIIHRIIKIQQDPRLKIDTSVLFLVRKKWQNL
ncbi:hypothetical protein HYV10_00995 [Candidatus Dependentiae bacterium]|nr:hypothetical protein [Candidatus Dependentiae bacterium]